VAAKLARGWVLAVDYGHERADYYAPERTEGTLSAYANHRREPDPFARPGEIDLTAHVDFTSLIESAETAGMKCAGFTDQHHFMVGLGAGHFADGANSGDVRAFQTLMHPQMMGMAFKVVCFAKGVELSPPLAGFRYAR
jgi:SAM-dependent MidA family methyltransferase